MSYFFSIKYFINNLIMIFLGLDKIEFLQSHQNLEIYQKAFDIIERFFGAGEEDSKIAPSVDSQGQQFEFPTNVDSSDKLPVQNFQF